MKHSGSARVILGTAVVALSIMAAKTALPSIPMQTTVLASMMGMALIFLLFRSDARRRRELAAQMNTAAMPEETDPVTIRRRLENRPLPQFSIAAKAPGQSGSNTATQLRATARPVALLPVLELVHPLDDVDSVLDLNAAMELGSPRATIVQTAN